MRKRITVLCIVLSILQTIQVHAQITIGSTASPASGALLQLKENEGVANATKGLSLPRVMLTDANNLYPMFTSGSPEYSGANKTTEDAMHTGLTVYNLTQNLCSTPPFAKGVYVWVGSYWQSLVPVVGATIPTITSIANVPIVCGAGYVNLGAKASDGATVDWYSNETGGSPLASGTSFYKPYISVNSYFYVEARDTITGCVSASRSQIKVGPQPLPIVEAVASNVVCGSDSTILWAKVSYGATIDWYDALTGGTLITTGVMAGTPLLTTTTTYYAEARHLITGCLSATRTLLTVTVADLPTIVSKNSVSICGAGVATISATASSGATIDWYKNATGGMTLASGTLSYTTPSLLANTTYYAQARDTTTACIAAARVPVVVNVNPIPTITTTTPAAICSMGVATISATASAMATVDWYSAATGGTPLISGTTSYTTPSLLASTTYYAQARDISSGCLSTSRTAVGITVNALPTVNSASSSATSCGGGSVTLSATVSAGATIDWYSTASGGMPLASGALSYATPSISATTTYYAEARNTTTGCLSATRTPLTVTVGTAPTILSVTPVNSCGGNLGALRGTASAGATIRWYTADTGGSAIGEGLSLNVGAATATYYAEAYDSVSGCASPTRTPLVVTNNPMPEVYWASVTSPVCMVTGATLTGGVSPGANIEWRSSLSGVIGSGTTYILSGADTQSSATFTAVAYNSTTGCINNSTSGMKSATLIVNPLPYRPTGVRASPSTVSAGSTVTLSATAPSAGSYIYWYAGTHVLGQSAIGSGSTFTTSPLYSTSTFTAVAINTSTGCQSNNYSPASVTVTVTP